MFAEAHKKNWAKQYPEWLCWASNGHFKSKIKLSLDRVSKHALLNLYLPDYNLLREIYILFVFVLFQSGSMNNPVSYYEILDMCILAKIRNTNTMKFQTSFIEIEFIYAKSEEFVALTVLIMYCENGISVEILM